jgi:nucleoside-diphosphate-sugar epimerase
MFAHMTQHSVLVTCGAGFIGSHLSHRLIESGYRGVHVFLREPVADPAEVPREYGRAPLPFEQPSVADTLLRAVVHRQFKSTLPRHLLFPARGGRRASR